MERYSVYFSRQARADMQEILHYIAVHLREPSTADQLLNHLEKSALSLETMPKRFALAPDGYLAAAGFRMTSVGNYLVFYTVDENKRVVNISRVLNGRQNWVARLTSDLPQ